MKEQEAENADRDHEAGNRQSIDKRGGGRDSGRLANEGSTASEAAADGQAEPGSEAGKRQPVEE